MKDKIYHMRKLGLSRYSFNYTQSTVIDHVENRLVKRSGGSNPIFNSLLMDGKERRIYTPTLQYLRRYFTANDLEEIAPGDKRHLDLLGHSNYWITRHGRVWTAKRLHWLKPSQTSKRTSCKVSLTLDSTSKGKSTKNNANKNKKPKESDTGSSELKAEEKAEWNIEDLVGLAFIDNPSPDTLTVIKHINGIKEDNHANNLTWSAEGDIPDPLKVSPRLVHDGEKGVELICQDLQDLCSDYEIACRRQVDEGDVRIIRNGSAYSQISRNYDFPSIFIPGEHLTVRAKILLERGKPDEWIIETISADVKANKRAIKSARKLIEN